MTCQMPQSIELSEQSPPRFNAKLIELSLYWSGQFVEDALCLPRDVVWEHKAKPYMYSIGEKGWHATVGT